MHQKGDHLFLCQRCGWKFWRSECRKECDGLIVCEDCYDEKHPQENVRSRPDNIKAGVAEPADVTLDTETAIATAGALGDTTIDVDSIEDMSDGDYIAVKLDNGDYQWTTVSGTPTGTTVTIAAALTDSVAVDNKVIVYTTTISGSDL